VSETARAKGVVVSISDPPPTRWQVRVGRRRWQRSDGGWFELDDAGTRTWVEVSSLVEIVAAGDVEEEDGALGAKGKLDEAERLCGGDHSCDDPAQTVQANLLNDDAALYGNVSTALVGVGVGALATGLVLYLTAPSGGGGEHALRVSPELTEGGFAVTVSGRLR
jgi:hypothetical protein